MKITFIALFIGALITKESIVFAQERKTNSVYVELMGNGIIYSAGFEKILTGNKDWLAGRVGICLYPESRGSAQALFKAIPIEFVTRGIHKNLEVGVGYTPFFNTTFVPINAMEEDFTKQQSWEHKVFARVGYISNPGERGFFWKAAFVPDVYDSRPKKNNIIGFGFAVGKRF